MKKPKAKTSLNTLSLMEALVAEEGKTGDALLDLPCGEGALCEALLKKRVHFQLYAGDIQPLFQHPSVKWNQINMEEPLPFSNEFFSMVACGDGISHIKRPFDFIAECHRILKPGGALFLSTPNLSSIRSRWRYFTTGFHNKRKVPLDERHKNPQYLINALDYPDIQYLLHSNGFTIEALHCNRIKWMNAAFGIFFPLIFLATLLAFTKEWLQKNHRNQQTFSFLIKNLRIMCRKEILFGETLLLRARKKSEIIRP